MDFKRRADWVPDIAAMEEPEMSLSAFLVWIAGPGIPAAYPVDPDSLD